MKDILLRNGFSLPLIGAGTWKITDREQMCAVVAASFELGYRLFDTAAAYSNEIALAHAIASRAISRGQILISDKAWNTYRGFQAVQEACKRSLHKLKTDYLDLYLIHWPASPRVHEDWETLNAETWRGMEALYRQGLVRAIGVCNFKVHHLEALMRTAEIAPMLNQIELHPGMPQFEVRAYCRENGIAVQASNPLGSGQILRDSTLVKLAAQTGKTPAQVALRWAIQHGAAVLPKSSNPCRLAENRNLFDFALDDEQMQSIDLLPFCGGLAIDPDEVTEFG